MAQTGSWPSIRKYGLLSTTALLDMFKVSGALRYSLESERRPDSVPISNAKGETAVVRDQKPINEKNLDKLLIDMSSREWYELLNRKTFFWLTRERLLDLLNARAYRNRSHTVITVDTAALIERHEEEITLSHLNSGSVIYGVGRRGRETFKTIGQFEFKGRKSIAELAVDYAVRDVERIAIVVEERQQSQLLNVLWRS